MGVNLFQFLYSLTQSEASQLLVLSLAIWESSSVICVFISFAYFSIGLFVFIIVTN